MPDAALPTVDPIRRVSTGVEGLDSILGGGLPQEHMYLLEGGTGTGKTTIGLQFLLEGARHGERSLFITLSAPRQALEEVAHSHGWSLAPLTLFELTPALKRLQPEEQESVFHPAEVELEDQSQTVRDVVREQQPQRVVIDSLSELRLLAETPFLYRRQLLTWQQFFAAQHCTVLLLEEYTADSSTPGAYSLVHGVLRLEQVAPAYGAARRRLNVLKLRSTAFRTGYHDYSIRRGGVVVYPRLVAVEHHQDFSPEVLSSGIAQLDALLGGGLTRGTSTLLTGPAGSGKSSLALAFACAAAERGEGAVLYSFEEGRPTLLARAARLGMHLQDHITAGRVRVEQVDPAELLPGEFIERVRRAVEQEHARVVILDSVNGFLQALPDEKFLSVQLHELLAFLNYKGVVTLLVLAQAGILGDSGQGLINLSYLADTILLLRYFEAAGRIRQALSVVKQRGAMHERTIRELQLGPERIEVGEPLATFSGVLTGVPTLTEGERRRRSTRKQG
jgi:circadian clock protein KaiC